MDLEFHQLEQRHADLRIRDPKHGGRLLVSLAAQGQQVPVIVVAAEERTTHPERYVLIDGYQRVAALQKLGRDTVMATAWPVSELAALVHHHHLSLSSRSTFEQAWFLSRLREQGLTLNELAQRLCRTKSWVSRRLALVKSLPESEGDGESWHGSGQRTGHPGSGRMECTKATRKRSRFRDGVQAHRIACRLARGRECLERPGAYIRRGTRVCWTIRPGRPS